MVLTTAEALEKREAELNLLAEMLRREQNRMAGAHAFSMEEIESLTEELLDNR